MNKKNSIALAKNVMKISTLNIDIISSLQRPLKIIAASSTSTQDLWSKLTQTHSSTQEKPSNLFRKISKKSRTCY